ncbi:DNA-binding FadR family transcriptional regulator [Rhodoligotrophos appendicifer]|uniref:FadR/GntR family transcriptional regulator n=1 Tax=Rhodoligotrophos appendicifer TaxID=987056 RepID=UPI00195F2C28|nr:FCD domain-containing protein [Rhodoligotrophos appendicifer]
MLPAYRVVFDTIERLIMEGRLKPGDLLPTETELAEQFNINRSTLREGIRLLEQNGLVERGAAKRLTIAVPQILDLATRVSRALVLHDVTFLELWETYMVLEPAATRLAALKATPQVLEKMSDNIDEMARNVDDLDRFMELDLEFHSMIAAAADNKPLQIARQPVSMLMMPSARVILPRLKTYQRVVTAHRNIVAAMKARDDLLAEEWMRKHTADFQRGYELIGYSPFEKLIEEQWASTVAIADTQVQGTGTRASVKTRGRRS